MSRTADAVALDDAAEVVDRVVGPRHDATRVGYHGVALAPDPSDGAGTDALPRDESMPARP